MVNIHKCDGHTHNIAMSNPQLRIHSYIRKNKTMKQFISRNQGYTMKLQVHVWV